jgi:hypothetical protein
VQNCKCQIHRTGDHARRDLRALATPRSSDGMGKREAAATDLLPRRREVVALGNRPRLRQRGRRRRRHGRVLPARLASSGRSGERDARHSGSESSRRRPGLRRTEERRMMLDLARCHHGQQERDQVPVQQQVTQQLAQGRNSR